MSSRLYPKSNSTELVANVFRNPGSEYRGAPLWSWNNRLDPDQLCRQIDCLKAMGFGGFHMHPRTGLATAYLGSEFMEIVRRCVKKAEETGMLAWLYDEDRWPSGYGGGFVTKDPRFRSQYLIFSRISNEEFKGPDACNIAKAVGARTGKGKLLSRYEVILRDGFLIQYSRLLPKESPSGRGMVWNAYLETAEPVPWFNHQTYVNTLDRQAIKRFIEVTHERYAKAVGDYFGRVIPAIFTDEPQFVHKETLNHSDGSNDLVIPFTEDLSDTFFAAYGQSLLDHLPELFWELPSRKASVARYRYHDHVCERFASAFADTVGDWCSEHGLALTGHMMEEPTLQSQTSSLGEAMRSLRSFHLPGIDILGDRREYTTAKQAQSAAHQYGREGVMSELYGITSWDFDFSEHKAQGDWQAALGVTVRVPHLSHVSLAGEAKRDYPPSISYQSPSYAEYPIVENHFARLNTVLTRGRPLVRVGVVHPIESYWLCFGPMDKTFAEREERDANFASITEWLLSGLIDFDFISESLLPSQCPQVQSAGFPVGAMCYDAVLVPSLRTIRASTLDRLETFVNQGGMVIFAGEIPSLMDAVLDERAARLASRCNCVSYSRQPILEALEAYREIEAVKADGSLCRTLLHQWRIEADKRYLFICHTDHIRKTGPITLRLRGSWEAVMLDTLSGNRQRLPTYHNGEWTQIEWTFPAHGHLLLELNPFDGTVSSHILLVEKSDWVDWGEIRDPVRVTLNEPNVLILDQAQFRVNDGEWRPAEETLRIENIVRKEFGLSVKNGADAQPWVNREIPPILGRLELKFIFESTVAVATPQIALENPGEREIFFDGVRVPSSEREVTGYYVDESIRTLLLPPFDAGIHQLVFGMDFTRKTELEWCYLLGDFGVGVAGRHARILAPVRELCWGDWTGQGLSFYAGNVTYHTEFSWPGGDMRVCFHHFKAPLLSVTLADVTQKVAFAPFHADLGSLAEGSHRLEITSYGNRVNAFGSLHKARPDWRWLSPSAWRTTGVEWAYEYQLKPTGILSAPLLQRGKPIVAS